MSGLENLETREPISAFQMYYAYRLIKVTAEERLVDPEKAKCGVKLHRILISEQRYESAEELVVGTYTSVSCSRLGFLRLMLLSVLALTRYPTLLLFNNAGQIFIVGLFGFLNACYQLRHDTSFL